MSSLAVRVTVGYWGLGVAVRPVLLRPQSSGVNWVHRHMVVRMQCVTTSRVCVPPIYYVCLVCPRPYLCPAARWDV